MQHCNICGYESGSKTALAKHKRTDHQYGCNDCGIFFHTINKLGYHRNLVHMTERGHHGFDMSVLIAAVK